MLPLRAVGMDYHRRGRRDEVMPAETPAAQVTRVAKRFARTHDLGESGGWFDKECQHYTSPLGVAWFTAMIIVELNAMNASHMVAFVMDLDANVTAKDNT